MDAALLNRLVNSARVFNAGVAEKAVDLNVEYVRGQAELICGALGLDTDVYRDGMILTIIQSATPQDSRDFLVKVYASTHYMDLQQAFDVHRMLERIEGSAQDADNLIHALRAWMTS